MNPESRTRRWAQLCFAAVSGLCLLVLLSWASGRWQLGTMGSQNIPMAPSTAISLLGLAATAWLWQSRPASVAANRFGRIVALAVLAVSLLVWARFLFGIGLPSFSPVRTTETVGQIPVGRMSPLTALASLLASLGLLFQLSAGAGRKVLRQTAAILLVLLLFLSTGVTLSYVLHVPLFYSGTVIPMAALTAVGFTLLGLGLLMRTGADTWPMGLVIDQASGTPPSRRFTWGFLALALLLMAGIGASGYAYLRHEQSDARRIAAETVSVVADLKVDQIAEWYREHGAFAVTISRTPLQAELQQFMTNPADIETRGRMLGWLWAIQQETGDSLAALVDSQGIVRLSVPSSMTSLDAHMLRDCRKALQQRTVVVQDLRRHQPDHTIHLSFIVPLLSDRSDVVLLLQIDAERSLFPLVESWPTRSPTAETFLVRREGNEVVYLNELRHRKGTALNLRMGIDQMPDLPAARAASGEEGVFEGNDYRQVPVVAALRAVPGTPWFMVAKIDREEIYAPFRRKVSMAALVLAVLLLTAISAISVLWYRRGLVSAERELVLERRSLESERNFRALFEQAGVGVAQIDARSGRFLRVNRRYRDLLGYDEEEMLRATWKDITHPEDATATLDNLLWLVEGESRELTLETRCIRKDGEACWLSVTVSPLWKPGDEPLQYVAVVQDITERKRAEAALMEQLEELRRWHEVTLGRETRILELKREVNQLLVEAGSPPRYVSPDVSSAEEPKP